MQIIWISVGFTSLALGIVGIVLPLLPTTPFLLLAAFSFARGSDRLHRWLLQHPRLGPFIHNWQTYRAIPLGAKWTGSAMLALVILLSVAFSAPPTLILLQSLVVIGVAAFLWSRPLPPG